MLCHIGNNSDICVEVYGGNYNPVIGIPLPITVPVGSKQVQVIIKVDIFSNCASVNVNAPKC